MVILRISVNSSLLVGYCIATKGWKFEVEWKDGTSSWIPLKILKESNPIEVAEYAVSRGIEKEPAFNLWVNHTL